MPMTLRDQREYAERVCTALESIAASLEKLANPQVEMDAEGMRWRGLGGGTAGED